MEVGPWDVSTFSTIRPQLPALGRLYFHDMIVLTQVIGRLSTAVGDPFLSPNPLSNQNDTHRLNTLQAHLDTVVVGTYERNKYTRRRTWCISTTELLDTRGTTFDCYENATMVASSTKLVCIYSKRLCACYYC